MVFSNNLLMGAAGQSTGYEIDQSIRFNDDDSAHLSQTFGSAGDRKTWTFSAWVKRANLGTRQVIFAATGQAYLQLGPDAASTESITILNEGSGTDLNWYTTQVFRDPAAWFHVVWQFDTTQSAADNRTKLFINGSQVTAFTKVATPDQDFEGAINNAVEHKIGEGHIANFYLDAYLAEMHFIDGTAQVASDFGKYNTAGVWVPIKYAGSYGDNGFFVDGRDSSDLGDDESGNGNDFASSGLAAADQVTDSPTNNFWTLNPIDPKGSNVTVSDGNLRAVCGSDAEGSVFAPMLPETGKWAWKITATLNMGSAAEYPVLGIVPSNNADLVSPIRSGGTGEGYGADGRFFSASAGSNSSYGTAWSDGDVIEVGWDADNGALSFWHAGSAQGVAVTGLTGRWKPAQDHYSTAGGDTLSDFGQSGYTPTDSSYKTLCTANLPTPTIKDGTKYFQTTLYEGDGSTQSIDQSGNSTFSPNFVWIKNIDADDAHALFDTVRGATKVISSNATTAEDTNVDTLTAFESDGFALGDDVIVNTSSESYVAWQWNEGATPGFDIVSYTGNATARTIAHNLGVVPEMIIVKNLADTDSWAVYHAANTAAPATDYLVLNTTAATADDSTVWNDTAPTSSVFSVGTGSLTNGNTEAMIAYVFAPVAGFSSFGSYVANAAADGPFIYTGFKPAFVIFKCTTAVRTWIMYDNARDPFNVVNDRLFPNTADPNDPHASNDHVDFLSNGFKMRSAGTLLNASGTYIFMAFAENPFGGDGAAPGTAR